MTIHFYQKTSKIRHIIKSVTIQWRSFLCHRMCVLKDILWRFDSFRHKILVAILPSSLFCDILFSSLVNIKMSQNPTLISGGLGWTSQNPTLTSDGLGCFKILFQPFFSLFQADLFLSWAPVMGHLNFKFVHGLIKFVYGLIHLISWCQTYFIGP